MYRAVTVASLSLWASLAWAQAPSTVTRVAGTVTSIDAQELVLQPAAGAAVRVKLVPDWKVIVSTPVDMRQIQPGSYIGTTNYAKPDGTGRSLEVHLSPPGVTGPGVDFVMDAQAGTTMTNGVVGKVVQGASERVATVNYGGGVRTITIPPDVPVVLNTPGERSQVVPGIRVKVSDFKRADGREFQIVAIGKGAELP